MGQSDQNESIYFPAHATALSNLNILIVWIDILALVYYYVFVFSSFQNHPSFKRYLFIDPEEEESCAVTSEQNHNRLGISRR